jgi:hypothetical protein
MTIGLARHKGQGKHMGLRGRYYGTRDFAMKMRFFVEGFFFDFLSAASLASAARLSLSHMDILLG